jgi:hypothetical protein
MPKRVIDFDAMWASDKLASCAEWAQAEYAWFYGLADASGSFELSNLRVIWGRVAAIRRSLTLERLGEVFEEFMRRGLLFTWEENGKRYGHWTGSDVPGRLPAPSWRVRLERLAPPVPRDKLAAYMASFGGPPLAAGVAREKMPAAACDGAVRCAPAEGAEGAQLELKMGIEAAQGQDLGCYDAAAGVRGETRGVSSAHVGAGPQAAAFGARVKAATLERERSRDGAGGEAAHAAHAALRREVAS